MSQMVSKGGEKILDELGISYKDLFENANDAIFLADAKTGIVLFTNPAAEKMFGRTIEQMVGLHVMDFHPKEDAQKVAKIFQEHAKKGSALVLETDACDADGKRIPVSINTKIIDTGKRKIMQGIFRDLSELKKAYAEIEKLNSTLHASNSALDHKLQRAAYKKINLTSKEKLGLYGLIRHPLLTDEELGRLLGISRTTITAIKNRLRSKGYFQKKIIPNFAFLGAGLITFLQLKTDTDWLDVKNASKRSILSILDAMPELVFCIGKHLDGLGVFISRSIGDFKNCMDSCNSQLAQSGVGIDERLLVHIPLDAFSVRRVFDFAPLLKHLLSIDIDEKDIIRHTPRLNPRNLSTKEKIVLYALTKYPEMTDKELAMKTSVSRITISKMKRRFVADGFMQVINYPDFDKLGCEVMSMYHGKLNPSKKINLTDSDRQVFAVSNDSEILFIDFFPNFGALQQEYNSLTLRLEDNEILAQTPSIGMIPISSASFHKLELAPLLKNLLNIKEDI